MLNKDWDSVLKWQASSFHTLNKLLYDEENST
jgi:hypothetical protein